MENKLETCFTGFFKYYNLIPIYLDFFRKLTYYIIMGICAAMESHFGRGKLCEFQLNKTKDSGKKQTDRSIIQNVRSAINITTIMTGIKYGNFAVNSRIFLQLVLIFLILQDEKRYVTVGNKTSMLPRGPFLIFSVV